MKKVLLAAAICLTLCVNADARGIPVKFGEEEKIEHIADVELKSPRNKPMALAQKVTTKWFILPYRTTAELALTDRGETGRYYNMPEGDDLAGFQSEGLLPNPLPSASLGLLGILWGHSLWIAIFIIIASFVVPLLRKQTARPQAAQTPPTENDPDAKV
ncbi:MAG: hypothetical protein LBO72_01110 [Helicobacteraceae bacterium]|jgi:hypothetical protein|nr:hypothetical protein [Helicobacteraceae bacterium]